MLNKITIIMLNGTSNFPPPPTPPPPGFPIDNTLILMGVSVLILFIVYFKYNKVITK